MTSEIILMPCQDGFENSFLLLSGDVWIKFSIQPDGPDGTVLMSSNKCNEVTLKKFKQIHKNENELTKKIYLSMIEVIKKVLEMCTLCN